MNNIKYLDKNRGFSLVELLIVIALIGIMMAIAMPGILSQRPKWFINGTTRDVASKLMAARIKAVQNNKEFVVAFDQFVTPNTFTLYQVTNFSHSAASYDLILSTANASNAQGGAVVYGGCPNMVFLPNGKVLGIIGTGSKCPTVGHEDIQVYHKKVEYVGSIFPPVYIYVSPYTGNIKISDIAPVF